jgi:GDPmannose 4,6-dehydratase
MMMQDEPEDYVVATGMCWSVEDFASRAFACVDLNWQDHVVQDPALIRPAEIPALCGDATKARERLDWRPLLGFDHLVQRMVDSEIQMASTQ